ncbi:MAG: AMP-binding protein [Bacteroidales bacterium]|nr:AMP-binding protein [Bacteroidales bacterium]
MEFKSVNKKLQESFVRNWDRPALTNYQGMTLAYRDVARRIAKLHIAFEQCGLRKGDKVAICSRNQANWGVSFMATITYGAVAVPILHEFKPGNIHYLVNHSEARVLFVDDVIWEGLQAEEMPDLSVVVQINTFKFLSVANLDLASVREHLNEEFGHRYPNDFGPEDINYYEDKPEELAIINYTSGTSGFSKGVMLPYRTLFSNIEFATHEAEPQLHAGMNVVAMLPSAHMYGMMFEFLFEITIGMHVHFLSRVPSPKIIMQAFQEIHPDIIIAVPLVMEKVYKTKLKPLIDKTKIYRRIPILGSSIERRFCTELTNAFGGRFEEVIMGGAAFNPEVEKFLHRIGFHYTVGYGMTECGPIICYAHWDKVKEGSAGRPVRNMEVRIDSPDPENVPGEVQVKGPNVCMGYYKNEEATKEAFTEDGWFRTGDMGVIDKDGYLFLRGRSKCMVLGPSGQNIYPEELEATINNFNYVVDSLVIEDDGGLTALIYPDWQQGEQDGFSRADFKSRIQGLLPEINKELPNYAALKKIELMPEDFERTPKKSIKRYLYQRNS